LQLGRGIAILFEKKIVSLRGYLLPPPCSLKQGGGSREEGGEK